MSVRVGLGVPLLRFNPVQKLDDNLTSISHSDTPLLFYIKSNCEDDKKIKQRQQAICLNEEDLHLIDDRKDVFELDYETFFKKQVLDQLDEFDKIDDVKTLVENYRQNALSK